MVGARGGRGTAVGEVDAQRRQRERLSPSIIAHGRSSWGWSRGERERERAAARRIRMRMRVRVR